jgi:hypothetical protein
LKVKQFGILIDYLGPTQQSLVITNGLNKLVENAFVDPIVFYKDYYTPLIKPLFCMMQQVEAWNFPHTIIATNLDSAQLLLSCRIPTKKLFYMTNLEWLYLNKQNYEILSAIYCNPLIDLLVRSEEHKRIVNSCWKMPIGIIDDNNFDQIINYVE